MNKEKLKFQLFVGKVSDVIGMEKTIELLKEVKDALEDIPSKKDNDKRYCCDCDADITKSKYWFVCDECRIQL
jgi:hypothetical protein